MRRAMLLSTKAARPVYLAQRWSLFFGFVLLSLILQAQGGMTLYNMSYVPQASYLNPGNTPQCKWYLTLPGISGVEVGLNNDFFSLKDVDLGLGTDWENLSADSLLSTFASVADLTNRLSLRGGADLFGFGIRSQKHYISFSIREEFQAHLEFPDELFQFLDDYQNDVVAEHTPYQMSESRFTISQYRPITLQYAYDILPNFTLGGSVSYISGIYTAKASNDTLIALSSDVKPKGYDIIGRMNIETGGFIDADTANITNVFTNPQNSGFALGLGGRLTTMEDRLDILFSAVNIGNIFWTQKVGLTSLTDNSFEEAEDLGDIVDTLFRVNEKANFSFNQGLIPEIFLGTNYFLNEKMSIGALMQVQPVYQSLRSAFGLSFQVRPNKWFGLSTGYIYADRGHNIPLGIVLNPGPVQLYVITDNVLGFLVPSGARQFHLNAGINLTFGKTERYWPETEPTLPEIESYPGVYQPEADTTTLAPVEEPKPVVETVEPDPGEIGVPPRDTIFSPDGPLYMEDEPDVTSYLVTNPVYLYRGPSSNTSIMDTIQSNTTITVLQKKLPDWWYVEYGDQSGWIQPRSIRPSFELPPVEQEEADVPDPLVQFKPLDYIMLDNTPLRKEASETSPIIHSMQKWDEVLVLEKTNSSWWKIRHEGMEGYVKSAMLNPRPENYVRPEQMDPPAPRPDTKPVYMPSLGKYEVVESTSLRAEPTHKSRSKLRLRKGKVIDLLEKTNKFWWKVEVNGLVGYCKAANLQKK